MVAPLTMMLHRVVQAHPEPALPYVLQSRVEAGPMQCLASQPVKLLEDGKCGRWKVEWLYTYKGVLFQGAFKAPNLEERAAESLTYPASKGSKEVFFHHRNPSDSTRPTIDATQYIPCWAGGSCRKRKRHLAETIMEVEHGPLE